MTDAVLLADADLEQLMAAVRAIVPLGPGMMHPLPLYRLFNDGRPAITGELAAFRYAEDGEIEVLLIDRLPTDDAHAGTCHLPGKFMLLKETTDTFVHRIAKVELGVDEVSFFEVGSCNDPFEPRGHHFHRIFLITLDSEPAIGRWVKVTDLPSNIVEQHLPMIFDALSVFLGVLAPGFAREYAGVAGEEDRKQHGQAIDMDLSMGHGSDPRWVAMIEEAMERYEPLAFWTRQINELLSGRS